MKASFDSIKKLVLKDWDLNQKPLALYVGGSIFSLALLGTPHHVAFYMGSIMLLTIVVAGGAHILFATTISEKKEQNLPFIMSLPVSPIEVGIAKVMANLGIFLTFWIAVVAAFSFVILFGHIPNGILVLFWVVAIHILVNYIVVMGICLVWENEGLSITAMVVTNLTINPLIMYMGNNPEISGYWSGEIIKWHDSLSLIVVGQFLVSLLVLIATLLQQSRRRTFI
jgi:ABC-2 type transport system permease protein